MEEWKKNQKKSRKSEQDWDVVLIGSDDVQVPCSKQTLRTHSPVFKKMFMNKEQDCFNLEYPGAVIEVVVNYGYVGKVELDLLQSGAVSTDDEVRSLVQVLSFSRRFEMPDVAKYMEKKIGKFVFQKKEFGFVCAILSELWNQGENEGPFWDLFFKISIRKPEECLLPKQEAQCNKGAVVLHPRLLVDILAQIDDQIVAVKCLQKWEQTSKQEDEISKNLMNAAKRVDLKQLAYPQLTKLFENGASSLFPMERLLEALLHVGNNPKAETGQTSHPTCKSGLLCVTGSGMKDVDGYYHQPLTSVSEDSMFVKLGSNGSLILLCVVWRPEQSTWTICVKNENSTSMYKASNESPKPTKDADIQLPFNSWESSDGAPSTLIMTMIETPRSWPPKAGQKLFQAERKPTGAAYAAASPNYRSPFSHQANIETPGPSQFSYPLGATTGPFVYGQPFQAETTPTGAANTASPSNNCSPFFSHHQANVETPGPSRFLSPLGPTTGSFVYGQ
mmetsp:Transcript_12610/g.30115  ORF Transcript_12610/g.30115 Transcript_12610/m.30115 type:complete len:503 (-) Transcript_12610:40-1548(-)